MSGDAQAAARRFLTRALSDAMGSVPSVRLGGGGVYVSGAGGGEPDSDPQPHGDGAVEAIDALGLLSSGEVERWRGRFRLGRDGGGAVPAPSAADADAASRHLDTLLDAVAAADGDVDRAGALDTFGGAVSLLLRLGYLDGDALGTWAERLDAVAAVPRDELEFVEEESGEPEDLGQLRAVAPVPLARHDGLCLTAVELYDEGVVVHWHEVVEGSGERGFPSPTLTASDDAGTAYSPVVARSVSYSPDEVRYAIFGSSVFPTPPPAQARTLTIRGESGGEWAVPLPGG
jgi:hypothetical protein